MTWPAGAWPTARAAGNADVVILGDSITSGQAATSYWDRSYAARLRTSIRALYGDGGSGFSPHWTGAAGGGAYTVTGTSGSVFAAYVPNGHAATFSGAARWTHQAEGTEVAVYLRRVPTYGTARWRVDSGPWQTGINCDGTTGYIRVSATNLDPGTHTIDVEATSGTVAVAGTEGRNTTGSRVHIMGLGARTSGGNAFSSPTFEANAAFRAASIGRWAPHLLIINLGVNDSNTATINAATYKTNVEAMITTARAARSDCDLVLVANALGKFDDNAYDGMRQSLYELAFSHGGKVVDVDFTSRIGFDRSYPWPADPQDWLDAMQVDPYAETVSHPSASLLVRTDTDPTGTAWGEWAWRGFYANGSDSVHPGDTGHHILAHILNQVVSL